MKKYLIVFAVIIILAIAGYTGYRYYKLFAGESAGCISALPDNWAFFIEVNNPKEAIEKTLYKSGIWKELSAVGELDKVNRNLLLLDSIIKTNSYIGTITGQKAIIAFFPEKENEDKAGFLFIQSLPQGSGSKLQNMLPSIFKSSVTKTGYRDTQLSSVNLSGSLFYYAVNKGLFIGSFSKEITKSALDILSGGKKFRHTHLYEKLKNTAGKRVDANIYFNYNRIGPIEKAIINKTTAGKIDNPDKFALMTETDLLIKKDEILLNGYTVTSDSLPQYLNCFRQEQTPVSSPGILPYNTTILLNLNFKSFGKYLSGYKEYLQKSGKLEDYEKMLKTLNKRYRVNIQQQFFSWIESEMGMAIAGENKSRYAFFRTADIKKAVNRLKAMSLYPARAVKRKEPYTLDYNEYTIYKIDIWGLLPKLFGPWFSGINRNYFIAIKDYIVFSDKPKDLMNLLDAFYIKKTLADNFNYTAFSDNISESSNIYFYCNLRKSIPVVTKVLSPELKKIFDKNSNTLSTLEGFAVQFSYINGMFYTNAYLKYNPGYTEVIPSNWEATTDDEITAGPFLIRNHKNGKLNVIVFDKKNTMYLINRQGFIKWKKQLPEAPQSTLYMVDYYGNGKYQYLFNSNKHLFLIDLLGNDVADYPVRLPAIATNGLSLFDYDNDGNYRIFLALDDNRIYDFDIKGEQVEGWNKVQMSKRVPYPVEFIRTEGKDYILITDENGNVTIANRRGETRIKMKKRFVRAKHSRFYRNETNRKKGIFLTTNKDGKLTYVTATGKVKYTVFDKFSPGHFFLYEDLNNNNQKDFIYLDKNRLIVFDKFKHVLLKHIFENTITVEPQFFTVNGKNYIAVTDKNGGKVYLFDKNGIAFGDIHISGTSKATAGSLNNNGKTNIITAKGNKVLNFLLE